MATPIGTGVVNSIARRHILPTITDNVYHSNVLLFRMYRANKRLVQGGFQIEFPLMYSQMAAGGSYQGFDLLDVSPTDAIKNGALDWKQYYVPVSVDGLTLIKTDQPEAIANFLTQYFAQAEMQMADNLGTDIYAVSATKTIDGLKGAIDDGTQLATYAGIGSRTSTNSFWQSQIDTNTYVTGGTAISLGVLNTLFGSCSDGGRHPTIIISRQSGYNAYWALNTSIQQFPVEPLGHDEQLAQSGFTNLLFNGVPWVVDSHCNLGTGAQATSTHIYMLNEDYFYFCVSPRADFYMEDFQIPVNQDAMVAKLFWAGNLVITNVSRSGKFTDVRP